MRISFYLICIVCFSFLASCSSGGSSSQQNFENVLRLSIGPPQTLDPHQVTGTPGYKVLKALGEPIVRMDYSTLSVTPGVAKEWSVSEDKLKYTFTLRENARWSNGEPITAQDFVYSWKRLLSPSLGNQFSVDFYAIKNAEAYNRGELTDFNQVGVSATGNYTLEIQLVKQDPLFIKRIADVHTFPVHQATVEKFGAMDDPTNPWIKAGNFVGNGPFILKKWELQQDIEVVPNPYYWDKDNIKLDGIRFITSESEMAVERMFRTDKLDIVYESRIPIEKIAQYKEERPEVLRLVPTYATYFYLFNTKKPPFDNVKVRKAFALSIDKELLVEQVTKAGEPAAYSLTPVTDDYMPPQMPKFNPERALELLAEAGYPNGKGLPKLTLSYNTSESHQKIAVAIQQMWLKNLGVEVTLENQEWKVFLTNLRNGDYQMARLGSISTFADPIDFLGSYITGHGMNRPQWSNARYDELIAESNGAPSEKERFEKMYEAEEIFLNDQPIAPLFFYTDSFLISPRVKNFEFPMITMPDYHGVYIENE